MTAYLYNSAEGQTNGTAVSAANSGGDSGDAFLQVTNTGTPTNEFSSAHAAHGTMSYHIAGDGATDRANIHHGESVGHTSAAYSFNLYFSILPSSGIIQPSVFIDTNNASAGYVTLQSTGQVRVYDKANTLLYTTTATLAINTWYRFDHQVTVGTSTTGTVNFQVSLAGSSTPIENYSTSTADCGTVQLKRYLFGKINTGGPLFDLYYDDLAWQSDTTTFITSGATPLMWTI